MPADPKHDDKLARERGSWPEDYRNQHRSLADDLSVNGTTLERFTFVAEAAVQIAAGDGCTDVPDDKRAAWACETAEALWWELCRRFGDDSVRISRARAARKVT